VGALSRVTHCFNDKHIDAARHLLRYLRTTKDLQLVYKHNQDSSDRQPEVWVDADYAPDYGGWADNYRSTSAWLWQGRLPPRLLGGRERGRSQLPQPQAACGRQLWLWRARKEGPE
jgi:hypothetical protein